MLQSDLHGGGDVASSAKIFIDILSGNGTNPQNDVVSTNAGIVIQCLQPQKSMEECIAEAQESLIGGKALEQFKLLLN